jgi:uncharacterized protein
VTRRRLTARDQAARRNSPPERHGPEVWLTARAAAASLCVLRSVLDDEAGRLWLELVEMLAARSPDRSRLAAAYGRWFVLLAAEVELASAPLVGDPWQHHLVTRLLEDENPFSLKAERAGIAAMGPALLAQVRVDLNALQRCYRLGGAPLARGVARRTRLRPAAWDGFRPLSASPAGATRLRLMQRLAAARDWGALAEEIAAHFAAHGAGLFGGARAFRWVPAPGGGHLQGVMEPDPIRLNDLIGYETERQPVVENTRQFVAGLPANNVLLYGDRGTGKSSTVKALLNEFSPEGLRLIEVAKEDLADYLRILTLLRGRRGRFILFVDDLSFEEHETQYKALKAALEGSLETRPENVVLYATSNRRRLVREKFSDRTGPALDDDVHVEETTQEKLSLADRFGIHAPFLIPDPDRYLAIAEALAAREGVALRPEEVRRRALLWSEWHNGHSCRTARQFVDALRGEITLANRDHSGRRVSAAPSRRPAR